MARRTIEQEHRRGIWIGVLMVLILLVGTYVAFAKMTKAFPFEPKGQTVRAVFENAATLSPNSPVRIAGVNVGEVTGVEEYGEQAARADLRDLLEGYGTALTYEPTAADDADQDADVQGETAAKAINDSFLYGGDAGKYSAIANTALLGTQQHDLSRLVRAQSQLSGELKDTGRNLPDLISNFNTTAGAFASESADLSETVRLLAPTLEEATPALRATDQALPEVRRLAIESTPGFEELPATIEAGTPWLEQTAQLLRPEELGDIARLTRQSAPNLAEATSAGTQLMPQIED